MRDIQCTDPLAWWRYSFDGADAEEGAAGSVERRAPKWQAR
jgi:hypothetical protein